ncbi:MAG: beta-ketoacyl synthase N-terminal-like domain-containing protein, partial [Frankia sp.]
MARNYREFWQNVVSGADCTQDVPPTHWSIDDYYDADPSVPDKTYCHRGGFLPEMEFSPMEFGIPPTQLEVTSVVQMLSLLVARDLLRDAAATDSDWYDPKQTGVVLGVTGAQPLGYPLATRLEAPVIKEVVRSCGLSATDATAIADKMLLAYPPWEENSFPGVLGNVIAGRIANRFDLGGMNCTVDAACASSMSAIRMAVNELLDGRSDLMITGGCDTENTIFGYMCFSKTQALSKGGTIRPFDDRADGTLVGEGIGMLALRRLEDARRDGNRVYAVIRGIGASSDGRFKSIYAPRAEGQQVALRRAYDDAACSPESVELFEGHATGTAVGDATELSALRAVLGEFTDERQFAAIGSVKSQIGHTKGAAGTASIIKLALSLHHKVFPPTINVEVPNQAIGDDESPFYLSTRLRPWIANPTRGPRRAAASAMGFGGTNFHVVLEETTADRADLRTLHPTARTYLWHAPDADGLVAVLRGGAEPNGGHGIPADHARVGFAAADAAEAAALRDIAAATIEREGGAETWSHPRGVHYRRSALAGAKVGALFAGQGSQYVHMGLSAAVNNPTVGAAFDEANQAFGDAAQSLASVVFPAPSFTAGIETAQEAALRRTEYAQPAIGALAAGQFRFLAQRGLRPDGYIGHSFGELAALWAAGSITDGDFFRIARARGAAMAPPAGNATDADSGAMVAVSASVDEVTALLAGYDDVAVCNLNAVDQVVVGGGTDAVAAFATACRERGITAHSLPVAAAFHTSRVAHAVEPFRAALAEVHIGPPSGPVYANTAGVHYGDDAETNRDVLARQIVSPVDFVGGLTAMHADGCTVFVEFGPKRILTDLVVRSLGDQGVIAFATDAGPSGDGDLALRQAAVRLAVLGLPITGIDRQDAEAWSEPAIRGMTVRLSGKDYVPAAREAAYRAALDDGYRVPATVGAQSAAGATALAGATTAVATPAAATAGWAGAGSGGTSNGAPIPNGMAGRTVPAMSASGPGSTVAVSAPPAHHGGNGAVAHRDQPGPVTGFDSFPPAPEPGEGPDGATVAALAGEHLALHREYLESQVRVAGGLMSALERGGPIDERLAAAVTAVKDQSVEISRTHVRVNEILATLTGLEAPPADPGRAYVDQRLPHPAAVTASPIATPTTSSAAAPAWIPEPAETASPFPATTLIPAARKPGQQVGAGAPVATPFAASPSGPTPNGTSPTPNGTAPRDTTPDGAASETDNTVDGAQLRAELLAVVSAKTGYPVDMLDPTMDLEADLGVDSIKRVQILGGLQLRFPTLPTIGPEKLAELRTLDDIATFLTPTNTGASTASDNAVDSAADNTVDGAQLRAELLAVVS